MKKAVPIITLLTILISSCTSQATKDEQAWLIKKTLNDLVFVEGGIFMMGDVGYTDSLGNHQYFHGRRSALPVHQVTLDSYSMGRYEVTYREFDFFCKQTGRELVGKKYRDTEFIQPELSASDIDWYDAKAYCDWLSELTGLPFSLATDAQWEYAARSRGKAVKYATDNGKIERGRNYKKDKSILAFPPPPPGTYPPNPLGIYDMSGNKPEWIKDVWYGYSEEPQTNPAYLQGEIVTVRGFDGEDYPIYSRGYLEKEIKGAGNCIRFVVNQKEPVDVERVLKKLGLPPTTKEDLASFPPKNWPVEEEE